jgi:hypothetical protein
MNSKSLIMLAVISMLFAGCASEVTIDRNTFWLVASEVPTEVAVNEAFTFTMDVAGISSTSDHIGAHFWMDTEEADPRDDDFKATRLSCAHDGSKIPNTVEVSCTIASAGTATLFGHMAYTEGDVTWNYWTHAYSVVAR